MWTLSAIEVRDRGITTMTLASLLGEASAGFYRPVCDRQQVTFELSQDVVLVQVDTKAIRYLLIGTLMRRDRRLPALRTLPLGADILDSIKVSRSTWIPSSDWTAAGLRSVPFIRAGS